MNDSTRVASGLSLWIIGLATPAADREWVLGDTAERYEELTLTEGPAAARRWLRREMWRVVACAPRHRLAVRRSVRRTPPSPGDRAMSVFAQDLRLALRLLLRSPGFSAVAVATLALGIGANSAMFAVVHAVLLKPLPFDRADRLMLVHLLVPDLNAPGTFRENAWSYPKYRTLIDQQQAFEDSALFGVRDVDIAGDGEPERTRAEVVTDRYPAVLGIEPLIGRGFSYDEAHTPGSEPVVMIGHALWIRRFGGDPGVLGRRIHLNATSYAIVGVLPDGFRGLGGSSQVWIPLAAFEPSRLPQPQSHAYYLVALRKPDVSEAAAIADARLQGPRIAAAHPTDRAIAEGATARSISDSRADGDVRRASFILLGAVGVVLLIACVNLTNLVWARAMSRQREVGVRVAIGATRARIVRQFLAEGAVLAGVGGAAGLALAWVLLSAATQLLPDADVFFQRPMSPGTARTAGAAGLMRVGASMIHVDAATLAFTCAVAMAAALLVSLMPALQVSLLRPVDALKSAGRSAGGSSPLANRTRAILVTLQIALALVLLAGAGLMIRSAVHRYATNIGATTGRILTVRLDLPTARYTDVTGSVLYRELLARVGAAPGVESVALGSCAPVSGGCNGTSIWFPPKPRIGGGRDPVIGIYWATPEYFRTLGITLLSGRMFTDGDRAGHPRVVVVNEAAARRFWPNESPLGKIISGGQGGLQEPAEVVGVVSNTRYGSVEDPPIPDVYVAAAQSFQPRMRLFVRSTLESRTLLPIIARDLRELDPALPLSEIKSMEDRVDDALWRARIGTWLLSAFAALAILLTAIGVFGVMAQTVLQRTAEIGIRMALGAQRRDVAGLVLGRGAAITGAGLVIGIGCALAVTRLMSGFLYGVQPSDPLTFILVACLLGVVALIACYIPARRATRVDAIVALRSE